MGSVKENLLTKGFSGKIGDEIVFRQVRNRTLFAKRPRKRNNPLPTEQSERFAKAVLYAKTALADPALRTEYENVAFLGGLNSAYVAALTDYLRKPVISLVYTDQYTGAIGEVIWITAQDDFKITSVEVSLQRPDGSVVETAQAVAEGGRWKFTSTKVNAVRTGTKVIVKAKDRPGQEVMVEQVLS
jgi:hypothetical protein